MANEASILTLITDFGLGDEYVGVVKGVILTFAPNARIVDITHLIPPQGVQTAAHLLARTYPYFPPGTVHLAIVDPGVGSFRPILAITADSQFFVGPDNGIFTPVFLRAASLDIHRVTATDLFLNHVGSTFHGRDIMAPIAAKLAVGLAIDRIGPSVAVQDCVHILHETTTCSDDLLRGKIVHVDNFGNLCTNISRQAVENFALKRNVVVRMKDNLLIPLCHVYADQPKGKLLALYDSHDFLEIAVNQGNAARELDLAAGASIIVSLCRSDSPDRPS